ncbi:hypothetical protein ACVIGB_001103 [Bradyrhizobium sp. USDA 4341]
MTAPLASLTAEPRPKTATGEMRSAAAERTVDLLIERGHLTPAERASSIESLAKIGERHMDGYQIAKRLDDWHHWDCNLEMAEDLDNFSHYLDDELRKAEVAWFERTGPQPPFPDGTRVSFERGKTGIIDRVHEYGPAKYAIKVDGDAEADTASCRRSIVNFEDVRAAQ